MAIFHIAESAVFGRVLPLQQIPKLYADFLSEYPDTLPLEHRGADLAARGFPESELRSFIQSVCKWGGYSGIGGRVLKNNTLASVRDALLEASRFLRSGVTGCRDAITAMNKLHSLGTPSFASKHLRFVNPEICPVFDTILHDALPYTFDPDGYSEFARDCAELTSFLSKEAIRNPEPSRDGRWYAADVEAALCAYVNES